jgi:hypothetical protein
VGLYSRVNARYIKTFYAKEFDQDWKTYGGNAGSEIVSLLVMLHDRILWRLNGKRDIEVDGPEGLALLVEAIDRNRIPVGPNEVLIPAMVYDAYKVAPVAQLDYKDALNKMIASGQIPKSYLENFPPQE